MNKLIPVIRRISAAVLILCSFFTCIKQLPIEVEFQEPEIQYRSIALVSFDKENLYCDLFLDIKNNDHRTFQLRMPEGILTLNDKALGAATMTNYVSLSGSTNALVRLDVVLKKKIIIDTAMESLFKKTDFILGITGQLSVKLSFLQKTIPFERKMKIDPKMFL